MNRLPLLLCILFLLSGCRIELYSNLSELEANQMMALLKSNDVDADKIVGKDGTQTLRVKENAFVSAIETLSQNGYPRKKFVSAEELFPSGQLISSPSQEKTRINYLKEQSLERMLSHIEGVVMANVVIGQDIAESSFSTLAKPSVSVLVKYSPEVNLKAFTVQIRSLMLNAVPGVPDENVALMLQPVIQRGLISDELPTEFEAASKASEPAPLKRTTRDRILIMGSMGAGILILATTCGYFIRRKMRNGRDTECN
jgi:type III secretion protein J